MRDLTGTDKAELLRTLIEYEKGMVGEDVAYYPDGGEVPRAFSGHIGPPVAVVEVFLEELRLDGFKIVKID